MGLSYLRSLVLMLRYLVKIRPSIQISKVRGNRAVQRATRSRTSDLHCVLRRIGFIKIPAAIALFFGPSKHDIRWIKRKWLTVDQVQGSDVDGDTLTYAWTFGPSTGSGQATS